MDTRQIEYILQIAEENNITKAAEKLFITQSALNQQLLKLERELGTPLFQRTKNKWCLTDAGRIYVAGARKMMQIKKDTYNQLYDVSRLRKGLLNIGLCPGRGLDMFTAIYPELHRSMPNLTATPLGGYRKAYTAIATGKLFGQLPYMFIIAFVIGLIMWFVFNYTRHGKYMYAIGGNEAAAEVSGVNVKKTKIIIYVTAAALYAIAGFLLGAKAGGASVNMGQGYELEAIAACTIGGVSVNGGIGRISGVVIGVLVFELLKSSMQFLGIPTNYQYIVQGIVIIVAIALDIRKYIAKK